MNLLLGNNTLNYNNNSNYGYNHINNPLENLFMQYMNINQTSKNNNLNTYININTSTNISQYIENLLNNGFNQPYTLNNVKKTNYRNKNSNNNKSYNKTYHCNYNNINDNYINEFDFDEMTNNKKKFLRKMTKNEKIEMEKWVEARKKLYPTKKNIEEKNKIGELKVEKGIISNLELKLRKKVNILKKIYNKKCKRNKINIIKKIPDNFINSNNINNITNNNIEDNQLEEGEIAPENHDDNCLLRKKRNIKKRIKKLNGKNNGNKENINYNSSTKKGFKYKINHLYDDLIKKDKIKEQNIILQAIRYLINLKENNNV